MRTGQCLVGSFPWSSPSFRPCCIRALSHIPSVCPSPLTNAIMPMFVVNTNVAQSAVPSALLSEATDELAKAMGKPAQVRPRCWIYIWEIHYVQVCRDARLCLHKPHPPCDVDVRVETGTGCGDWLVDVTANTPNAMRSCEIIWIHAFVSVYSSTVHCCTH